MLAESEDGSDPEYNDHDLEENDIQFRETVSQKTLDFWGMCSNLRSSTRF